MIIYKYDPKKNPDNQFLNGVPLRDIDDLLWESLTEAQQKAIEQAKFYVKKRKRK